MAKRIAIVVGAALLLGAVLFTAVPAQTTGADCGWWVAPEYDKAESKKLAENALAVAEEMSTTDGGEAVAAQGATLASSIARNYRDCTDKLDTRRNVSLGLLIAAGLIPAAILYVGKREDQITTP